MAEELKWVTRWTATRAAGRSRYIVRTGILAYGLPMFIVTTFMLPHAPLTTAHVLVRAAIWVVGGVLFGATMWAFMDWRYRRRSASP